MSDEILVTIEDAGHRLGLGRSLTYELVLRGALRSIKIGRARRVPVAALEEFVAQLREEQAAGQGGG